MARIRVKIRAKIHYPRLYLYLLGQLYWHTDCYLLLIDMNRSRTQPQRKRNSSPMRWNWIAAAHEEKGTHMPIYEYQCQKCKHAFDHLARTLADKPAKCPQCGAKTLAKQLSTFSPAMGSSGGKSCSMGSCATPSCSTGTCPFG